MRRLAPIAIIVVGLAFGSLLVPGSSAREWLLRELMAGPRGEETRLPTSRAETTATPLRVAIGAMISPERTHLVYEEFFSLLASRLGRPVRLSQRKTYREINELLEKGVVDVAWICTGAWVDLQRKRAVRLLAVPIVEGRATYRSYLIAGPTTTATSLDELRGLRFAFTDPDSLTGCLWPRRSLAARGFDPTGYFAESFYTHAHDSSIEAVRRGLADGASIDGLVFDFLAREFPKEIEGVRVLDRSEPFPIPPLVVPASLDDATTRRIREALQTLHLDPAGRTLLQRILVDRFERGDPNAYERFGSEAGP